MPHVLVAGKIHAAGLAVLKQAPGITLDVVEEVSFESYAPLAPKADAILLRTQPLPAELISRCPNLRIVSRHGVGYDAVDVAALTARGIALAIVGDVNSRAVAEHALMLMLSVARRTVVHDKACRSGNWNERNAFNATELDGKRLLVVGFGRIGRRVAQLAQAFGMTVAAHDPFVPAAAISEAGCDPASELDTAMATADYVSLHLPKAPDGPVMTAKRLALMKPGAILVNAARGELVDEKALDQALRDGKLRGAGLDVLAEEPPQPNTALLNNPRVTLSPHNAGLTQECAERMGISAAQNIIDFFTSKIDARLVVNVATIRL